MRTTEDLSVTQWRKSSYSGQEQGEACVEVADSIPTLIPVRDSKTPLARALTFTPDAWCAFVVALKSGTAPIV